MWTFRLLTKQAGTGVGEEVQLDVLQRAVEGHPRLAMVWYAWRANGGHVVESLLEMLEEATADGMFGARGARPGGAAWAAVAIDDASGNQAQGSAQGSVALIAKQGAVKVTQAPTPQWPPVGQRKCFGRGQVGHIQRNCKRKPAGGREQSEHAELLQAVRELVTEQRSTKSKGPKQD